MQTYVHTMSWLATPVFWCRKWIYNWAFPDPFAFCQYIYYIILAKAYGLASARLSGRSLSPPTAKHRFGNMSLDWSPFRSTITNVDESYAAEECHHENQRCQCKTCGTVVAPVFLNVLAFCGDWDRACLLPRHVEVTGRGILNSSVHLTSQQAY